MQCKTSPLTKQLLVQHYFLLTSQAILSSLTPAHESTQPAGPKAKAAIYNFPFC